MPTITPETQPGVPGGRSGVDSDRSQYYLYTTEGKTVSQFTETDPLHFINRQESLIPHNTNLNLQI